MIKRLVIIVLALLSAPSVSALDLSGATSLRDGQNQIKVGMGILFGIISPPSSFSHASGLNKAFMLSETVSYGRGFGDRGIKNLFLEFESLTFQSRKETVSGVTVHGGNNAWALTLRGGGNFIHTPRFLFGGWLQTSVPVVMDKDKFVNPVLNYGGLGLNLGFQPIRGLGISQSGFMGSGLFSPTKRNPNVRSATLGVFNFGEILWNREVSLSTGVVIEADLKERTDAAYQSSTLADGRIKNFVFITPLVFRISLGRVALGETWRLEVAHAIKWIGKSARGSQFSHLGLSKTF